MREISFSEVIKKLEIVVWTLLNSEVDPEFTDITIIKRVLIKIRESKRKTQTNKYTYSLVAKLKL